MILLILIILIILPQIYYYLSEKNYRSLDMASKYFKRLDLGEKEGVKDFYLTNTDGFDLFVRTYRPKKIRGIVQIIHGMSEHSANYHDFASFLKDEGYLVVLTDHRGHGKSLSKAYPNGYMRRARELVDDQLMVLSYIKDSYKDLPYTIVGHSMGSMVARLLLKDADRLIDRLLLTGTVAINKLSGFGVFLANIICFYLGDKKESGVIDLIVGNKGLDFISFNKENIKEKSQDRMRIFKFKLGYSRVLIELNKMIEKRFDPKNKDLEIKSLVGEADPITKGASGHKKSLGFLKSLGYKNVSSRVYKNMKHEILNEDDNKRV